MFTVKHANIEPNWYPVTVSFAILVSELQSVLYIIADVDVKLNSKFESICHTKPNCI